METIRWGILATGNVANSMAQALSEVTGVQVIAVASRTQQAADAFGARWDIPRRYGAYADLVGDDDVDVVYIATPHSHHYENMMLCLDAGKHVLCEKAFTLNAREAEACIARARERRLFLMEAMWMCFFPAMAQVRQWVAEGRIGDIRLFTADFCADIPYEKAPRLYEPNLGGGALLDLGVYPLTLATSLLGLPEKMISQAQMGAHGVDELDTMLLSYATGAKAALACSMRVYKPREAFIVGTNGYIKIHEIFFRPAQLTLQVRGRPPQEIVLPFRGNGYVHEVEHVQAMLRTGRMESDRWPLAQTLQVMRLMDRLRADWGLVYPGEKGAQV